MLVGLVVIPLMRPLLRFEPPPPPRSGQLPPYTLVDQNGEPFGSAELAGHVYVVHLFFTRCPTVCPSLIAAMQELARRYRDAGRNDVELVSISVDPAHDSPQRLHDWAEERGLDLERWHLLTGEEAAVRALVEDGFRLALGRPSDTDVAHSAALFLVDRTGGLRGRYRTTALGVDEIFHRSLHVANEIPRTGDHE